MDYFVFQRECSVCKCRSHIWFRYQEVSADLIDAGAGGEGSNDKLERYTRAFDDRHATHDFRIDVDPCLPVEVVFLRHRRNYPTSRVKGRRESRRDRALY